MTANNTTGSGWGKLRSCVILRAPKEYCIEREVVQDAIAEAEPGWRA